MDVPELICFDLPCLVDVAAGTTEAALDRALRRLGLDETSPLHASALAAGLRWPGAEARQILGRVFGSDVWAEAAAAAFDEAFGACVVRRGAQVAEGGKEVVASLRQAGASVCLTTEFYAGTREAVLDVLSWPELVAMLLSADPREDALQPNLIVTAAGRLGVQTGDVAVVSGSISGVAAGRAAGAGWVVGVVGAGPTAADLHLAGATAVARLAELVPATLAGRLLTA